MRYDGTNLEAVLEAHGRWLDTGENDDDRADFSGCDLSFEVLACHDLYGADFRGAELYHTNLYGCNLANADLTGAKDFSTATLDFAELEHAIGVPWLPMACPEEGSFIAWKKATLCHADGTEGELVVLKLLIPEDARRISTLEFDACRSDKAVVLEIQSLDGKTLVDRDTTNGDYAVSMKKTECRYMVGETALPDGFDENRWHLIGSGIHFFINRHDAARYPDIRSMRPKQNEN